LESPKHDYELPVPASAWTHSVELGAGIYFLAGRTHVVGRESPAEQQLLDQGALLIATLRFDGDPPEGRRSGRAVHAVAARDIARRYLRGLMAS
jgi:hypothetical protein